MKLEDILHLPPRKLTFPESKV